DWPRSLPVSRSQYLSVRLGPDTAMVLLSGRIAAKRGPKSSQGTSNSSFLDDASNTFTRHPGGLVTSRAPTVARNFPSGENTTLRTQKSVFSSDGSCFPVDTSQK